MGIILIHRWTLGVIWTQCLHSFINFLHNNLWTTIRIPKTSVLNRWTFQICHKQWVLQCFQTCHSKSLKICSICLNTNKTFNWLLVAFNNKWLTNNLDSYRKHLSFQTSAKFRVRLPSRSLILMRNQRLQRSFSAMKLSLMTPNIAVLRTKKEYNNHWHYKARET